MHLTYSPPPSQNLMGSIANQVTFFIKSSLQTSPTEKDDPDPVVADSDPLVASSMRVFCARNSQREGRSPLFQWDWGISVGSSRVLQVLYVIPRPGVPLPMISQHQAMLYQVLKVI